MTNPDDLERAAGNLAGLARDLERYDPWGGTRSRSDAADLRLILAANRKMAEALAASPSVGGWEGSRPQEAVLPQTEKGSPTPPVKTGEG